MYIKKSYRILIYSNYSHQSYQSIDRHVEVHQQYGLFMHLGHF